MNKKGRDMAKKGESKKKLTTIAGARGAADALGIKLSEVPN